MMTVAAKADQAYTKVFRSFPALMTEDSITVALVRTLSDAQDQHTMTMLDGIEEASEQWPE